MKKSRVIGYELLFDVSVRESYAAIPSYSKLPRSLKNLLSSPRKDKGMVGHFVWEDYGTDHNNYSPKLVVTVSKINSDSISQMRSLFERINDSIKGTKLRIYDEVEIYFARSPPNSCCGRYDGGSGKNAYLAGASSIELPDTNPDFDSLAKTLWGSFKLYARRREKKLEERIDRYNKEIEWLKAI